MMDGPRWTNTYASRCSYDEKKIKTITSLAGLQDIQINGTRYAGLNMHAFSKHGTVEFRYAMGSADWQKIYSLTSMYLRMIAAATSKEEIPNVIKIKGILGRAALDNITKNIKSLEKNRDTFFDFLQIKGGVKSHLYKMFNDNVKDIGSYGNTPEQLTESFEKIKFSLKDK